MADRDELRERIGVAVLYAVPGDMPGQAVRDLIDRLVDIASSGRTGDTDG